MDDPRFLLSGECDPLSAGRRVRIYATRGPYVRIYPQDTITRANGHTRKCCPNNLSIRRRSRARRTRIGEMAGDRLPNSSWLNLAHSILWSSVLAGREPLLV